MQIYLPRCFFALFVFFFSQVHKKEQKTVCLHLFLTFFFFFFFQGRAEALWIFWSSFAIEMICQQACILNVWEIQMVSLWKGMKWIYFVFWSDCCLFLFCSDVRFPCLERGNIDQVLLANITLGYFKLSLLGKISLAFMLVDGINPQTLLSLCRDRRCGAVCRVHLQRCFHATGLSALHT